MSAEDVGERMLDILVADDAPLFRGMAAKVLTTLGRVREVGEISAMFEAVDRQPPDVLVQDIRMPPTGTVEGLEAALRLRIRHPGVAVLLLSNDLQLLHVQRLLSGGPAGIGYLLKERVAGIEEFLAAVRTVAGGGQAIDPEVVAALLGRRRMTERLAALTDREREVLSLMAQGLSNAAISARMCWSPKTVEAAIRRILEVLELPYDGVSNRRVLAVLTFLEVGGGQPTPAMIASPTVR